MACFAADERVNVVNGLWFGARAVATAVAARKRRRESRAEVSSNEVFLVIVILHHRRTYVGVIGTRRASGAG